MKVMMRRKMIRKNKVREKTPMKVRQMLGMMMTRKK
jgi:hypothetical protein